MRKLSINTNPLKREDPLGLKPATGKGSTQDTPGKQSENSGEASVKFGMKFPLDLLNKIRRISANENRSIPEIVATGMRAYLEKWEKENGPIPPMKGPGLRPGRKVKASEDRESEH